MRVAHYFEFADQVTGGIQQSVRNQRRAMEHAGIDYVTVPDRSADVLHLNVMGPRSLYHAIRARREDMPVVIHTHNTAEEWVDGSFRFTHFLASPLRHYLTYAYGLADALICPSTYNEGLIKDYAAVETHVITNGVDQEKMAGFDAFRDEYRDRYGLERTTVFCVGHVLKRKGLADFIETARRRPEYDFVWFGYLHRNLKTRSTRRMIDAAPENCQFTGYVDDIRGAFSAGDIFFFPTKEENQGIALLEALACNRPIVIRDIPIYRDWLDDEVHCLKGETVDDFVRNLDRIATDEQLRASLAANTEMALDGHTLDAVGEKLRELYERIQS